MELTEVQKKIDDRNAKKEEAVKKSRIDAIFDQILASGKIKSVNRFKYMPYDPQIAMSIVERIGKAMNPSFVIDDNNRFVYENMIRWIHADDAFQAIDPETKKVIPGNLNAGIMVAGPTGTGKSFLIDLFALYCKIDNVKVGFNHDRQNIRPLSWQTFRSDQICEEFASEGSIDRFKKMNIIAIQDVGAEPAESMFMGNRMNVIRQILEYRGDRQDQIMLMSSNISMTRMSEIYGDRVESRLHTLVNYFELKGKDRRK